jgi:hypothetical protein
MRDRSIWDKIIGRYECRPVGVVDIATGEYLGDYGEGRKSRLHRKHCCGSLCKEGIRYDPEVHAWSVKPKDDRQQPGT